MEMRLEQRQERRQRAAPVRQQTMRQTQAQINQDVAVALERVIGRLENMEQWRKEVDDERREDDRRRDSRDDQQPDALRQTISTYGGCLSNIVYVALTGVSLLIGMSGLILAIIKQ